MYCKRKMYDLLQRKCIRGCGFVGVASGPGNLSGEVGNYGYSSCLCPFSIHTIICKINDYYVRILLLTLLGGLAVDWISDKIYFTNGYTPIKACDLEGHNCTEIVSTLHHSYVFITVDPHSR